MVGEALAQLMPPRLRAGCTQLANAEVSRMKNVPAGEAVFFFKNSRGYIQSKDLRVLQWLAEPPYSVTIKGLAKSSGVNVAFLKFSPTVKKYNHYANWGILSVSVCGWFVWTGEQSLKL